LFVDSPIFSTQPHGLSHLFAWIQPFKCVLTIHRHQKCEELYWVEVERSNKNVCFLIQLTLFWRLRINFNHFRIPSRLLTRHCHLCEKKNQFANLIIYTSLLSFPFSYSNEHRLRKISGSNEEWFILENYNNLKAEKSLMFTFFDIYQHQH
jgi:hypothetical protein